MVFNLNLKDEKGKNFEIGILYCGILLLVDGDEVVFKLMLFCNYIDDMIVCLGDGLMVYYINIDKVYLCGGEIEVSYVVGCWDLGVVVLVVEGKDQDGIDLNLLFNDRLMLLVVYEVMDVWCIGVCSMLVVGCDKFDGDYCGGYGVYDIFVIYVFQQGQLVGVEFYMGVDNVIDRDYMFVSWVSGLVLGWNFKFLVLCSFQGL